MPKVTVEQLRDQLSRRTTVPVYALYGAETYLRDLAADTIAKNSFDEGDFRDFNDNEFSLAESDNIQNALAAAEQLPMMSKRRVVRITDVRVAMTSARDTLREEHEAALAKYLERPAESTVLIFIADELNGNRRITKLLKDKAALVEFEPLRDKELSAWVRRKVAECGSEIDERSLSHLLSTVGPDARRLTTEIQKLSVAALPGRTITTELTVALVHNSRELTNFELTDHLVAGRKPQALAAMNKLLDDGAEPLALLGLLASNYRRMLTAKSLMDEGAERTDVLSAARVPSPHLDRFIATARRAGSHQLSKAIERLAEADVAIKSSVGGGGKSGARMQIEVLVCELAAASKN